jgi:hypothetical protein
MLELLFLLVNFFSSTNTPQGDALAAVSIKNSLHILSGEAEVNFWIMNDSHQHYMNTGFGPRSYIQHVDFPEKFEANPQVTVSLKGYDASSDGVTSIRLIANVVDITNSGFNLEIKTWWDSKIHAVWVTWLAIGS